MPARPPLLRSLAAAAAVALAIEPGAGAAAGARCAGRYAGTLEAMTQAARARSARAEAEGVYCLRAIAVYEEISYARGGRVRRQYHRKVRHGTGFAYRHRGEAWLVATNAHVIAFPEVTGDGAPLDGVPPGARLVRTEVRIVGSEADPDVDGGPALAPVVADPTLDLAILASPRPLALVPWRLGRSAELRVGDAVLARGYPLGAFAAANAGRVIAVGQRDLDRGWDHEDFAVDALLNLGSSGSPVLAVDCATGEPELVGVYHAGYKGAQGLNVVIAIDQLRALLADPRPSAPQVASEPKPDPAALRAAVAQGPVLFPFGGRVVRAERDGDGIRYALMEAAFPLTLHPEAVVVDRGGAGVGAGGALREALRTQLALVLAWRSAEAPRGGRERLLSRIHDLEEEQQDLVQAVAAGAPGVTDGERSAVVRRGSDGEAEPPVERAERTSDPPWETLASPSP